jgi:arylsulfatase A-like enzyme
MTRLASRPLARGLAAVVLATLLAAGAVLIDRLRERAAGDAGPPNIVLILTDDQRWDTLWAMPNVRRLLGERGVTYSNAFVVNSLCCPSRASILTGKYSKHTGVWGNRPPHGGFAAFDDATTIATQLDRAGYETAHVGKYLNGYFGEYVPPGWDRWFAFSGREPYRQTDLYGDYVLNIDGALSSRGRAPDDYSTDVLADEAVRVIRGAAGPLFLQLATAAPHTPSTPAPEDLEAFPDLPPHRPPNYDEADVGDKPRWVRDLDRIGEGTYPEQLHRAMLQSLLAVDRAVERIVGALEDTGRLDDTMIVFASDNGFSWGEHRWTNKQAAFEENIRIPMVLRYDRLLTGSREDDHLVLNLDLAPTFAAIAGTTLPGADGRSLVPLLTDPGLRWRSRFALEHQNAEEPYRIPAYCGLRTLRFTYVRYVTLEEELYDLAEDPWQLTNVAADPAYRPVRDRLRRVLRTTCDPPPPGATAPFPP